LFDAVADIRDVCMGLVKTRRLAAMQKQTTYAKATVVRQRANFGTPLMKSGLRNGRPRQFCVNNIVK